MFLSFSSAHHISSAPPILVFVRCEISFCIRDSGTAIDGIAQFLVWQLMSLKPTLAAKKEQAFNKKLSARRGTVGKIPIVWIKDRATNQVRARFVPDITASRLQSSRRRNTTEEVKVYTDQSRAFKGFPTVRVSIIDRSIRSQQL